MDDQTYEINIKRFMTSIDHQLKKLKECVNRLNEVRCFLIIESNSVNFKIIGFK